MSRIPSRQNAVTHARQRVTCHDGTPTRSCESLSTAFRAAPRSGTRGPRSTVLGADANTVPGIPAHCWLTPIAAVLLMMPHTESTAVSFRKSSDSVNGEDRMHLEPIRTPIHHQSSVAGRRRTGTRTEATYQMPKWVRCSMTDGWVKSVHGPTP